MPSARAATAPIKRVIQPQSVPPGQRVRGTPKKQHKDKPSVGKGKYVKAPLLRDKLTSPRWIANAALNNPGNVLAGGAVGTGAGLLVGNSEKKIEKADRDREKNTAAGALIGGGAGHFARVGGEYGAKAVGEHQIKPLTNRGSFGPYKDSPHKAILRAHEKAAGKAGRAGGGVRDKARYFDENFPKGVPSYRARKVGVALSKKPVIAAAVLGPAAIGGALGHERKVNKSMSTSAFGVDHFVIVDGGS